MRKNRKFFLFTSIMVSALLIAGLSARNSSGESNYEIQPEIRLPEYKTDTARLIDSYERTVNRVLDLREQDSRLLNYKLEKIETKIDTLVNKLEKLSERMQRIEKELGIEQKATDKPPADNKQKDKPEKPENN